MFHVQAMSLLAQKFVCHAVIREKETIHMQGQSWATEGVYIGEQFSPKLFQKRSMTGGSLRNTSATVCHPISNTLS